jgi:hypothetical protein
MGQGRGWESGEGGEAGPRWPGNGIVVEDCVVEISGEESSGIIERFFIALDIDSAVTLRGVSKTRCREGVSGFSCSS